MGFLNYKIIAGALLGILITTICSIFLALNLFDNLHNTFSNNLYTLEEPSDEIVIIAIDKKSTENPPEGLGLHKNWTRDNYSKLLNILVEEQPRVVAFDILFKSYTSIIPIENIYDLKIDAGNASTNKEKLEIYETFQNENISHQNNKIDQNFSLALRKIENVVLLSVFEQYGQIIQPLDIFSINAGIGYANTQVDESGVLRAVQPSYKQYEDFGLVVAKKALGKNQLFVPMEDNKMMINYFAEPGGFKRYSFADVIYKNFEADTFKDKIVLIGFTDPTLVLDQFATPKASKSLMPGVEIRANEIQTIIQEKHLTNQGTFSLILTILAMSVILAIILSFTGITLSTIIAFASILIYYFTAHYFYGKGLIINMIYPFIAILLTYLAVWVYRYFIADKTKRELKGAFSHYVSKELVNEITKDPEKVKLGGEKRTISVFFSDIKGSTTYSEQVAIEDWVSQINEYFTVMEGILQNHGGTLDKYEGDAIMGFWNAPIDQADHINRAYSAALDMRAALSQLHIKWQQEGKPLIEFRIGINTGEAIVGNFGSVNRFDYTAMGDTVNTASRLESSANKAYGTRLIVANTDITTLPQFTFRELDTVFLPGKKETTVLYELIAKTETLSLQQKELVDIYALGLKAYRARDFNTAKLHFEQLPADPASKTMLARLEIIMEGASLPQISEKMEFKIINK